MKRTSLLLCLFIWAAGASAQTFSSPSFVSVGFSPNSVFVADVNLDGRPDLLTANQTDNTVSVRLGDGTGNFTGTTSISVGFSPNSVFVADVNLDGKPDLLVANYAGDDVSVRLGDGTGNFTGTTSISVGDGPVSIFVADVNLDGKPDLLVTNFDGDDVSVRLGDGTGNFTGTTSILTDANPNSLPSSVFVADVNLDGKPDLLVANYNYNDVSTLLGDGTGNFTFLSTTSVGFSPTSVFVADVNLDGKPDFLAANINGATVSVRLGDGTGNFTGTTTISVGGGPINVFVTDVNLDGKPDFATANVYDNTLSVRLGDGTGNFTGTTTLSVGNGAQSVFVADVNLDGRPDLLNANSADNAVSVLLNTTSIIVNPFGTATNFSVGGSPRSVFVADVNLDGKPDFLTANSGSSDVSVRLGDGTGNFTGTTSISVGSGPFSVFVADVNLDGKPDLLVANYNDNDVSTLLGDGTGNFTFLSTTSVGFSPNSVFVADVNLDGKPDFLTANSGSSDVSVRLGDGTGNFTGTTSISVGSGPFSVFVADVNLDGKPDLLTANFGSSNVSVRLGDGTGNFTGTTTVSVGFSPTSVFVADVNLDGKPDFLTANTSSNDVSVRLGDGTGNFTGTTSISVGSGPFSVFVADVNLDGKPDLLTANFGSNDVSVVLNNVLSLPDYTGPTAGIAPGAYNNVTFTASGNLPGNVTVDGALTLNSGVVSNLNGNSITVNNDASGAIAGAGFLTGSGSLVRAFNGNFSYAFPYLQGSNDRSATVTFTSGAGTGTLTYQFFNAPPGTAGLPQTYVGQTIAVTAPYFWRIDATGTPGTYTLALRAQNTDGVTNVATLRIAKRPNAGSWSATGAGTGSANTGTLADPTVVQSGMTGFSEFSIGGGGGSDNPLPVELVNFTGAATRNGVQLRWTTASEQNNAGFEVRRSEAGSDFQTIASYAFSPELKGRGTVTSATNYEFLDASVEAGKTYLYRLRSVDYDGTLHDYAQTVTVEVREPVQPKVYEYALWQNYPNPFNPTTTIRFTMKEAGVAVLTITDVLGRVVLTETIQASVGENAYRFAPQNLGSGVYFYTLRAGAFQQTKKMMLVK